MTESSLKEMYVGIEQDLRALVGTSGDFPRLSAETSLIALLKERHPLISWVGFYWELVPGSRHLWIGAYQGPVACVEIPPGKGVCGASFDQGQTLIVPDVDQFPGHIACDSRSRSEIVVPVRVGQKVVGVLDLDSHSLGAFGEIDRQGIESCLQFIQEMTKSPS